MTPPFLWPSALCLSRFPDAPPWGPGAQLSAECWLALPQLVSYSSCLQLSYFLSWQSYIIVHAHLLVGVTITLIQHIHGQGYNSDNPRTDAPVIYIGVLPILTSQTGRRSIYNIYIYVCVCVCVLCVRIYIYIHRRIETK